MSQGTRCPSPLSLKIRGAEKEGVEMARMGSRTRIGPIKRGANSCRKRLQLSWGALGHTYEICQGILLASGL